MNQFRLWIASVFLILFGTLLIRYAYSNDSNQENVLTLYSNVRTPIATNATTAIKSDRGVWGGADCGGAGINPFANQIVCDETTSKQPINRIVEDAESSDDRRLMAQFSAERQSMIGKALNGDASAFIEYVNGYSRRCRSEPPEVRANFTECNASVLAANDAQFVKISETLAVAGDTRAQLALGQWYLFNANSSLNIEVNFQKFFGAANSVEEIEALNFKMNELYQTHDFQKAAYFFHQAAPSSEVASAALELLESVGVKALSGSYK